MATKKSSAKKAPLKAVAKKAAAKKVAKRASVKVVARFAAEERCLLPGSEKDPFHLPGERPASGKMTVSVILRRKKEIDASTLGKVTITRAQYARDHGADRGDIKLMHAFAKEFGLTVGTSLGAERRTVMLSGSAAAMQRAFGVELKSVTMDGATYRVREGGVHLPMSLAGVVVAVLGLDNRPQANFHYRVRGARGGMLSRISEEAGLMHPHTEGDGSFTPVEVGQLYGFPAVATAKGQTIGLLELGGGYRAADLATYFKSLGMKTPVLTAVSVNKAKNSPGKATGADGEVMLDIEVAGAVAPGAKIVVYFSSNDDQGFIDGVATAIHDAKNKPSVISISWGNPEIGWTKQSMDALDAACQSAAALGITITVAAGDDGSGDGVSDGKAHVDFPASSPHVLACGGTRLLGSGSTITAETVWSEASGGATGGGVSSYFGLPDWQKSYGGTLAGLTGRGVPDVAGDADPATGYQVRVDGQDAVIGGTSAVAPLWAGLIALSNARNKTPAGFIQPTIYAAKAKACFRDITSGSNGAWSAGPGWDACTGLGSPNGAALITLLSSAAPARKAAHSTKKATKRSAKKSAKR